MGKKFVLKAILNKSSIGISGGTKDYNELNNLPTVNGVEVKGDLTFEDLGITKMTPAEIDTMMSEKDSL